MKDASAMRGWRAWELAIAGLGLIAGPLIGLLVAAVCDAEPGGEPLVSVEDELLARGPYGALATSLDGGAPPADAGARRDAGARPAIDWSELRDQPAQARDAARAYYAALAAYPRGDQSGYFGAFAPVLECWYGRQGVDRATILGGPRGNGLRNNALRRASGEPLEWVVPLALRVEEAGSDRVVLHDWGWTGRVGTDTQAFHSKRIVLARAASGAWQIVAEASLGNACGQGPAREALTPPAAWSGAQARWTELRAAGRQAELCGRDGLPKLVPTACASDFPCSGADCSAYERCRARMGFVCRGQCPAHVFACP
ncbi:MAG: hypothetical protein IT378_05655 [Sandaracinaceae bacterium]|nr:hypothetical protein [Sandaracinaceae bacterium]